MSGRPAHQATTRHLGALHPFCAEPGSGLPGVVVGRDVLGGLFVHDPFVLCASGQCTNPNMVVFGAIGRGKSAFVKSWLWRQGALGRRAWVVDPKGEYGPLARAWGSVPIRLAPGGRVRLNPLEASGIGSETVADRTGLLASLVAVGLGRGLLSTERAALDLAVAAVSLAEHPAPVLPDVVGALLAPTASAAAAVGTTASRLADEGRPVALEPRRLVEGDLGGMFDSPTSRGIDVSGSLVVLDLSAVYQSAALPLLMICAMAFLGAAARGVAKTTGRFLVIDEAWAVLAEPGTARWLQASWKLARAHGVSNIAVLHRVSDLDAVGRAGSAERALAHGLLADSETRVVYGQPAGEREAAVRLLDCSDTEAAVLGTLGRGTALWKVGGRRHLVRHILAPSERAFVDTDGAMRAPAGRWRAPAAPAGSGGAERRGRDDRR